VARHHQKERQEYQKEYHKAYGKKYREKHQERIKEYASNYIRPKLAIRCTINLLPKISPNLDPFRSYANDKERKEGRSRRRREEYQRFRIYSPEKLIAKRLRSRLYNAIKHTTKSGSAIVDLGCSIEQFKGYLMSKFQEGMSWDNYGKWHIDHIKPLSKFDLTDRQQFLEACHYTNLQPLWAVQNLKKGSK
jgi:hypothetical protein